MCVEYYLGYLGKIPGIEKPFLRWATKLWQWYDGFIAWLSLGWDRFNIVVCTRWCPRSCKVDKSWQVLYIQYTYISTTNHIVKLELWTHQRSIHEQERHLVAGWTPGSFGENMIDTTLEIQRSIKWCPGAAPGVPQFVNATSWLFQVQNLLGWLGS